MGVPPSLPNECVRQIGVGQCRFQLITISFRSKAIGRSCTRDLVRSVSQRKLRGRWAGTALGYRGRNLGVYTSLARVLRPFAAL